MCGKHPRWKRQSGYKSSNNIMDQVLQSIRENAIPDPQPILLVQDNCSIHNYRVARNWFEEHPLITPIRWPSRSPDLNPIENIWGWMTNSWDHENERRPDLLEDHCRLVWQDLVARPVYFEKLVQSMDTRIEAVLKAQGQYTKYYYYFSIKIFVWIFFDHLPK